MSWYKKAEERAEEKTEYIFCPFCGELDFDKMGLKNHLERGYCEVYNTIDISSIHKLMDNF